MKTIWVLLIAAWTQQDGTVIYPIDVNEQGRQFSSYTECFEQGLKLANKAINEYGVGPNDIDGLCLLVEVDDAGEIKGLYPAELPDEEGA